MPGRWQLRADCQAKGGKLPAAVVSVAVGPGAGQGLLAAHSDMRVSVLSGRADPILGLWQAPDNPDWGFQDPTGKWFGSVTLVVATPSGYENQEATPGKHKTLVPPCTTQPGIPTARFTRAGTSYKVSVHYIKKDCSLFWRDEAFTATFKVTSRQLTITFTNGWVWDYTRYTG